PCGWPQSNRHNPHPSYSDARQPRSPCLTSRAFADTYPGNIPHSLCSAHCSKDCLSLRSVASPLHRTSSYRCACRQSRYYLSYRSEFLPLAAPARIAGHELQWANKTLDYKKHRLVDQEFSAAGYWGYPEFLPRFFPLPSSVCLTAGQFFATEQAQEPH